MRSNVLAPAMGRGALGRRAVLATLAVLALTLLVAVPAQAGPFDVSDQIMCQCGCGSVLTDCPHQDCGWGIPAKQFIEEQLKAGRSEDELVEYYVSQYGEKILAAPRKTGFNMTAWVVPFVVLALGGAGLYFLVRMWAQKRLTEDLEPVEAERTGAAPPEQTRRLEDELKNFD